MPDEMIEFSARVDKELYDRFIRHVPAFGGPSWFIRAALEAFCDEADRHPEILDTLNVSVRNMVRESHRKASI